MAHFAELDENNVVLRVIVVDNKDILDSQGNESEQIGVQFCQSLLGMSTRWKQCSYNGKFRKNYPGPGSTYDETKDAFIHKKPWDSWILNEDTCQWEPPIPRPEGLDPWVWDEPTVSWKKYNFQTGSLE